MKTILQSIVTKVIPATNFKPTRIKAVTAGGKSRTKTYHNCEGNDGEKHYEVAAELAACLGWGNELAQGATKDGYCFVLLA